MQQILIWSLVSGFVELVVVVGGVGANSRVMFGTDRNRTVMCCKGEIHLMVQRSRKFTFPRGETRTRKDIRAAVVSISGSAASICDHVRAPVPVFPRYRSSLRQL